MKACMFLLLLLLASVEASAQQFEYPVDTTDRKNRAAGIAKLSTSLIKAGMAGDAAVPAPSLAYLQIAAGRFGDAAGTIGEVMADLVADGDPRRAERWSPYLIHSRAGVLAADGKPLFEEAYRQAFRQYFAGLDDLTANRTKFWFSANLARAQDDLQQALRQQEGRKTISLQDALELIRRQVFVDVYRVALPVGDTLFEEDENFRYVVRDDVLITTPDGATLSAVVARGRNSDKPQPTALLFTIYTDLDNHRTTAVQAAARGYVGVVADARGKRLSRDEIVPYEHEADDAHAVIDWISRQPWSNGEVGMYGGSYSGFAAWAAAKRGHSALKTIVPWAAAIPGQGLPMENNVFLNANYAWAFHVANSRELDHGTYSRHERWTALNRDWYASGRPYREIDQVDGAPNPLLQRWLRHPAYDGYWQRMVPYGNDFARIGIPVLSITGYYDDGQISALHYFREHYRHRPDAEHYLLIGPYDHFGAQAPFKPRMLRGYEIDTAAQFDTQDITFQWLDHVMRNGERPLLVKDRINHQIMGADTWQHAASIQRMSNTVATLHLSGVRDGGRYRLAPKKPAEPAYMTQHVDFSDRTTTSHGYYPDPIVLDPLRVQSALSFVSDPFHEPVSVSGMFSGELKVRINKRDMDVTVVLYEMMADGKAMQLSHYLGRASHAGDMSVRKLLAPFEWTTIPFERTRMVSRRLRAGSRLLVVVDVVKDAFHQINYGTGKDVSDESIADAGEPLRVDWHTDSVIRVPLFVEPSG